MIDWDRLIQRDFDLDEDEGLGSNWPLPRPFLFMPLQGVLNIAIIFASFIVPYAFPRLTVSALKSGYLEFLSMRSFPTSFF